MSTLEENTQVNEWIRFGLKLGVSSALHPFEYAKVLIQIGFEPVAPIAGRTLFGAHTYILPNIFQYASHIKKVDGTAGCFRGLAPKLLGNILSTYGSDIIAEKLGLATVIDDTKDESEMTEQEVLTRFKAQMKRDLVIHSAGIVITQPFHVISLRMMAEFVGKETKYSSILSSIGEIYREEGILGFFAGFIPRLLCDISCLVLSSTTIYIINKYVVTEKEHRQYTTGITQFVFQSLMYPLQVVSTCMAISGSNLQASRPPTMPSYETWLDCWRHLKSTGDLKRGSSLFWRYYNPGGAKKLAPGQIPMPPAF